MDTSKRYIKMCEEAKEIQKLFFTDSCATRATSGDFVWSKVKERVAVLYYNKHHGSPPDHYITESTWLPRQDQLQEMVGIHGIASLIRFFTSWFDEYVLHGNELVSFNSMEQLWLAFVMKEKFNKGWRYGIWKKAN